VAARRAFVEDFGFDMPDTITLDVKVAADHNASPWTDGESRPFLRGRSREQLLARPAPGRGFYSLYGMCHELGHVAMYPLSRVTEKNRPNLLARKAYRKRLRVKQFGGFFRVYLVQSVHAQHSEEDNAARAS
jgi:hypothetical protein